MIIWKQDFYASSNVNVQFIYTTSLLKQEKIVYFFNDFCGFKKGENIWTIIIIINLMMQTKSPYLCILSSYFFNYFR